MILDTLSKLLERATDFARPRDVLQFDICGDTVSLVLPNGAIYSLAVTF